MAGTDGLSDPLLSCAVPVSHVMCLFESLEVLRSPCDFVSLFDTLLPVFVYW